MKRIADLNDQELALLREMLDVAVKAIGAQVVVPSFSLFKKIEDAYNPEKDSEIPF